MSTFVITGEFITEQTRSFVIERDWQTAVRFLQSSIMDVSTDLAIDIIRGKKKFVGDSSSGISVVNDTDVSIDRHFNSIYAYAVYSRNRYWAPYARVTSWGAKDVATSLRSENRWHTYYEVAPYTFPPNAGAMLEFWLSRSIYYMDNPHDDLAMLVNDRIVLYREVSQPPLWISVPVNPSMPEQLPERGAHLICKSDRIIELTNEQTIDKNMANEYTDGLTYDLDQDKTDGVLRTMLNDQQDETPSPVNRPVKYGYISPTGEFYECTYFGHSWLAKRIYNNILGMNKYEDPQKILDDNGWIRLSVGLDQVPYAMETQPPTQQQRNAISRWFRFWDGNVRIDKLY